MIRIAIVLVRKQLIWRKVKMDGEANADKTSYWIDYGKAEPGSKLIDPPTLDRIVEADEEERDLPFTMLGDLTPEPRLIPYDRYHDPKHVPLEVEHIWTKEWQIACREEDIPNIGDRISYDIVNKSYLVVRTGGAQFRAFHNSCPHRARKLCEHKGSGSGIQCGFHGWMFGLDGKLEWVPFEQEFPQVTAKDSSLKEIKVETWGGNVFINPDPDSAPLAQSLGPLVRHFEKWPQENRYTAMRILVKVRCNWKAAQEAFMEGYHVVETHSDGMPMFGSVATRIDIWSEGKGYVSRLCTPGMTIDPYVSHKVTPRQGLILYCNAQELPLPPEGRGLTAEDARKYAAQAKRDQLEKLTGRDYSHQTVSYMIDMGKYFLFPNHHPWWGEGLPWWYNFKPLGEDPNSSEMEIRILLPIPADGKRPPLPEPIRVDFDEKAADNPLLGAVGHIIDQDLANMNAVQLGFKAAPPEQAFLTTAVYQEAKIRRFHEIYDQKLGLEP